MEVKYDVKMSQYSMDTDKNIYAVIYLFFDIT